MTEGTAQDTYKLMLRTQIAPRLRSLGFKGSGNNFSIQRADGWRVDLGFQGNRWNTSELVTFDVNVSISHRPTMRAYEAANLLAFMELNKQLESPPPQSYLSTRLSFLCSAGQADFPWEITPDSLSDPIADEVVRAVESDLLPMLSQLMAQPLPSPTPPAERADLTDQEIQGRDSVPRKADELVRAMQDAREFWSAWAPQGQSGN